MVRVNADNLEAVLERDQPVADENLVWGAGYFTTWDGKHFQVAYQILDQDSNPVFQYDDDGNEWFAMDFDQPASNEAQLKYLEGNPPPAAAAEADETA